MTVLIFLFSKNTCNHLLCTHSLLPAFANYELSELEISLVRLTLHIIAV